MIEIYHVPGTRGVRVIWVCEELGLPYQVVPVDFSVEYRDSDEWRRMNPVGKVPVMMDGELKVFESGAMVQYLLDRYGGGRLQPRPGTPDHARYLQWCWFAEATFARPLGEIVNHRRALSAADQSAAAVAEMRSRAWLCVQAVDAALIDDAFLLGADFSAADIMMGYTLMIHTSLAPGEFPSNVASYWQRLQQRPGYQVATADLA